MPAVSLSLRLAATFARKRVPMIGQPTEREVLFLVAVLVPVARMWDEVATQLSAPAPVLLGIVRVQARNGACPSRREPAAAREYLTAAGPTGEFWCLD